MYIKLSSAFSFFIISILTCIIYSTSVGQNSFPDLIPFRSGPKHLEKWGYCNNKKQIIIPMQFDMCYPFEHGVAEVVKDTQHWLINTKGESLTKEKFIEIYRGNGLILVKNEKHLLGMLDSTGKYILPVKYKKIDRVMAQEGNSLTYTSFIYGIESIECGIYSMTGNPVIEPLFSTKIPMFKNGFLSIQDNQFINVYDTAFKLLIRKQCDALSPKKLKDKTIFKATKHTGIKSHKEGLINLKGKLILPIEYRIGSFSDDVAVCLKTKDKHGYGYINSKGKVIIPFQYDQASDFHNGLAVVRKNRKHYLINKKGTIRATLCDSCYRMGEVINNRIVTHYRENYICGYLDTNGHVAIPFVYTSACEFKGKYAIVRDTSLAGKQFRPIPLQSTYKLIDLEGKEILKAFGGYHELYDYRDAFNEDRCFVIQKPTVTYLSQEITDSIYQQEMKQYNGLRIFRNLSNNLKNISTLTFNDKIGVVDRSGDWLIQPIYDSINIKNNRNCWILVKKEGKWGYIDLKGNTKIECKYENEFEFENGLALVWFENSILFIDENGTSYFQE